MIRTVKEISDHVKGELIGNGKIVIKGISGINEARDGDIAFLLSAKYEDLLEVTAASCVIVPKDIKRSHAKPLIKVDNPSIVFSKLVDIVMPERIQHPTGIHNTAEISKKAKIGKNVAVGSHTVVEDGAMIDDNTIIYPLSYIGKNTRIGGNCIIYSNVTIREGITIGSRVIIHPGTVIGSDGFGYDTDRDGTHVKIPQLGTVIIEDDVELGSCVTVDRARFSKTVIGKGTKIDNLVQIAHNVIIGPNCLIAAQSGISGSCEIGRNVVFGGQVGVADHIKLGDFVIVGAQSGVTKSFPAKTILFGYPARPVDKAKDTIGHISLLPKLFERVRILEAKIKKLENK